MNFLLQLTITLHFCKNTFYAQLFYGKVEAKMFELEIIRFVISIDEILMEFQKKIKNIEKFMASFTY